MMIGHKPSTSRTRRNGHSWVLVRPWSLLVTTVALVRPLLIVNGQTTASTVRPAVTATGYDLVGSDGGVFVFGGGGFYGSLPGLGGHVTNVVGMGPSFDGGGYLL